MTYPNHHPAAQPAPFWTPTRIVATILGVIFGPCALWLVICVVAVAGIPVAIVCGVLAAFLLFRNLFRPRRRR